MRKSGRGGGKSTWKVTVRQLESLIRLSEALAKLECQDDVLERHVREAYRLLNKSIVRVEQPDIDLDDNPTQGSVEVNGEAPRAMEEFNDADHLSTNGDACKYIVFAKFKVNLTKLQFDFKADEPLQNGGTQKKKVTVSFEEYKSLTNQLVAYIRTEEERMEREGFNLFIFTEKIFRMSSVL